MKMTTLEEIYATVGHCDDCPVKRALRLAVEQRDGYNLYALREECLDGELKAQEVFHVNKERDDAALLRAAEGAGR